MITLRVCVGLLCVGVLHLPNFERALLNDSFWNAPFGLGRPLTAQKKQQFECLKQRPQTNTLSRAFHAPREAGVCIALLVCWRVHWAASVCCIYCGTVHLQRCC